MYCNDILNIIGEYLDLVSYKQLVPIFPSVFTVVKYDTYQKQYEQFFSIMIRNEWDLIYDDILKLNQGKSTPSTKYFFYKNQYNTVSRVIYALEYCDIFISVPHNLDVIEKDRSDKDIENKCILEGYLIKKPAQPIKISEKISKYSTDEFGKITTIVKIEVLEYYLAGWVDIFSSTNTRMLKIQYSVVDNIYGLISASHLGPLLMLYYDVMSKFRIIQKISFDSLNKIGSLFLSSVTTNNMTNLITGLGGMATSLNNSINTKIEDYDDQYNDLLDLIEFRKINK